MHVGKHSHTTQHTQSTQHTWMNMLVHMCLCLCACNLSCLWCCLLAWTPHTCFSIKRITRLMQLDQSPNLSCKHKNCYTNHAVHESHRASLKKAKLLPTSCPSYLHRSNSKEAKSAATNHCHCCRLTPTCVEGEIHNNNCTCDLVRPKIQTKEPQSSKMPTHGTSSIVLPWCCIQRRQSLLITLLQAASSPCKDQLSTQRL